MRLVYHNGAVLHEMVVRNDLAINGLNLCGIEAYLDAAAVAFEGGSRWWEELSEKTGCEWRTVMGQKLCIAHDGIIHSDGPSKGKHIDDHIADHIEDDGTTKTRDAGVFQAMAAGVHLAAAALEVLSSPGAFAAHIMIRTVTKQHNLFVNKELDSLGRKYGTTQAHLIAAGANLTRAGLNLAVGAATAGMGPFISTGIQAILGTATGSQFLRAVASYPTALAVLAVNRMAGTNMRRAAKEPGPKMTDEQRRDLHEKARAALHYSRSMHDLARRMSVGMKQAHKSRSMDDIVYKDAKAQEAHEKVQAAHGGLTTKIGELEKVLGGDRPSPERVARLREVIGHHLDAIHEGMSVMRKRSEWLSGLSASDARYEQNVVKENSGKIRELVGAGEELATRSRSLEKLIADAKPADRKRIEAEASAIDKSIREGMGTILSRIRGHTDASKEAHARAAEHLKHHEGLKKLAGHGRKEKMTFATHPTLTPARIRRLGEKFATAGATAALRSFLSDRKAAARAIPEMKKAFRK